MNYYLRLGDQVYGPYTTDQIHGMLAARQIPQGTEYSETSQGPWQAVILPAVPPTPPPVQSVPSQPVGHVVVEQQRDVWDFLVSPDQNYPIVAQQPSQPPAVYPANAFPPGQQPQVVYMQAPQPSIQIFNSQTTTQFRHRQRGDMATGCAISAAIMLLGLLFLVIFPPFGLLFLIVAVIAAVIYLAIR